MILTPAEEAVIRLVATGAPSKAIAAALGIAPNTVKAHLANVMRRTKAPNRTVLALWYADIERAKNHERVALLSEFSGTLVLQGGLYDGSNLNA
jgi:DNA-binding CsgD family transcriptional regulator